MDEINIASIENDLKSNQKQISLISYLISLEASKETLANVFDENGKFKEIGDFSSLWEMDCEELISHFMEKLKFHYELQQLVLNNLMPTGFNDHGPTHIERVTRQTYRILKESGTSIDNQKIGIFAAACHDLGNMIDRKTHHKLSCLIAKNILKLDEEYSIHKQILDTIFYHEEKAHSDKELISTLDFPALALILADKTDVTYLRVHAASDQKEAINDLHVVINFMVDNSKLTFYTTKIQWRLLFNPNADRVVGLFQHLLKHDERKWVPLDWQQMYRKEHIEYLFIFYAKILQIYLDRIRLSTNASLLLFPETKKFEFVVEDTERHILIKREFLRETANNQIEELRHNLVKNQPLSLIN